jgi:hypothetical protein
MIESRQARYVNWLFDSTPVTIRRWVPEEQLKRELGAYFDRVWIDRVETPEWLAGYAKACPVEGAESRDYGMREIEILPDATILAGIHFRDRDVNHPFVGVFAQTRDLTGAEMEAVTSAGIDGGTPGYAAWYSGMAGRRRNPRLEISWKRSGGRDAAAVRIEPQPGAGRAGNG